MYKPRLTKPYIPLLLAALLAGFLIAFNIVRILKVPITHDEAWTYMDYITSYRNIRINNPATANNHILHSFLTKFFTGLFNSKTQFFLRLTNLLALMVYLLAGYGLLRVLFKNNWWVLGGLILLNLNPFMFEFWGLARGYGLAISLMTVSIYFLLRYYDSNKMALLIASLMAAILSTYSNFSILNFYLALNIVILFRKVQFRTGLKKPHFVKEVSVLGVSAILLYIMIAKPLIELKRNNELYYGGETGFITDTVYSLVRESIYTSDNSIAIIIISYAVVIFTVIVGIIAIWKILKQRHEAYSKGILIWLLLFTPVLSTILQYHLLGNLYLIERTALFFYPLFIIQLLVWLSYINSYKTLSNGLLLVFTTIIIFNFGKNINTVFAKSWEYDKYNLLVINRMVEHSKTPVKVKLYWMFIPSFNYYQETKYPFDLKHIEKRWEAPFPDTAYDYYYIHSDDIATVPSNYIEDTSFFDGKYVLLKKKD